MKVEDRISYYIAEAERRLQRYSLQTNPAGWMPNVAFRMATDKELEKRHLDGTISYLYETIAAAQRALGAYHAGVWDAFARHHETMIGQSISARIPDLESHQQRKKAKNPRGPRDLSTKSRAKAIFDEKPGITIDKLADELRKKGIKKVPARSTLGTWMQAWRQAKSN
jgi:hypothetical protein